MLAETLISNKQPLKNKPAEIIYDRCPEVILQHHGHPRTRWPQMTQIRGPWCLTSERVLNVFSLYETLTLVAPKWPPHPPYAPLVCLTLEVLMLARQVSTTPLLLGCALVVSACNAVPAQCPSINDMYRLEYQAQGPAEGMSPCALGPYQLKVNASGSGIIDSTEHRLDRTITTEVIPRGCQLDMKLTVIEPKKDQFHEPQTLAASTGTLTIYSPDSISGRVTGVRYQEGEPSCRGDFVLNLVRVTPSSSHMPLAGAPGHEETPVAP